MLESMSFSPSLLQDQTLRTTFPRTHTSTRILQTRSEVRATVHLELLLGYKQRDRSAVESISNVERTAFSLIFQIQWKHPHDSLHCLILNTFPLSLSSQRDLYEKPR